MGRVHLDLNNAEFQRTWFSLDAAEAARAFACLRKMSGLDWDQLYRDKGLRWEAIRSRGGARQLYSLRATQKMRIVAFRDGEILRLQGVYPGHDSAYQ